MFDYTGAEITKQLAVLTSNSYPNSDKNNNNTNNEKNVSINVSECDKYLLRPRARKRNSRTDLLAASKADIAEVSVTSPTGKSKPPPLSKYRRKTANARERSRMREINVAFETLRKAVPLLFAAQQCSGATAIPSPSEKLTKITTLRLAMRYIAALTETLQEQTQTPQQYSPPVHIPSNYQLDLDSYLLESSDADSLCTMSEGSVQLPEQSITPVDFTSTLFDDSLSPVFDNNNPVISFDTFFMGFS